MWHKLSLNHGQVPSACLQNILLTSGKVILKSICAFGIKAIPSCAGSLEFSACFSTRNKLSHGWPENFKCMMLISNSKNREDIFLLPHPLKCEINLSNTWQQKWPSLKELGLQKAMHQLHLCPDVLCRWYTVC